MRTDFFEVETHEICFLVFLVLALIIAMILWVKHVKCAIKEFKELECSCSSPCTEYCYNRMEELNKNRKNK